MRQRGLSGSSLARLLHQLNPAVKESSYRRDISRWKRGEIPQEHNRVLLAEVLGLDADSLARPAFARMELLEAALARLQQRFAALEEEHRPPPPREPGEREPG
jgi:hypothetical protein